MRIVCEDHHRRPGAGGHKIHAGIVSGHADGGPGRPGAPGSVVAANVPADLPPLPFAFQSISHFCVYKAVGQRDDESLGKNMQFITAFQILPLPQLALKQAHFTTTEKGKKGFSQNLLLLDRSCFCVNEFCLA